MNSLYADAPETTVLRSTTHRARVRHECNVCPEGIRIGQTYQKIALVQDGQFSAFKMHSGATCGQRGF